MLEPRLQLARSKAKHAFNSKLIITVHATIIVLTRLQTLVSCAMSSATTPVDGSNKRSTSRNRLPTSRPTTPLRPASRSSLRDGQSYSGGAASAGNNHQPLESLEPAFAELSDSMADLEANLMHMQLMHESLARFSESFASFLYGLNMNAFCVDFPEVRLVDLGRFENPSS